MSLFLPRISKCVFINSIKLINMSLYKRYLFSSEMLGIENYLRQKELRISKFGSVRDKFMERMANYIAESSTNTIYTDDLKIGVYLVESDQEIETIVTMVKRFHLQNDNIKFSTFQFGPLVMRFLHILNKPAIAKDLFFDKNMAGFFSQMSSYIIFMDLMFINELYDEIIKAIHHLENNNLQILKINIDCLTLFAAACCKLNTKDSFEQLNNILKKIKNEYSATISMRCVIYGCMLALNQNKPDVALEILSMIHQQRVDKVPIVYTNIKLLTFTKLGKYDEAITLIKDSSQKDFPVTTTIYPEIFEEIITNVQAEFKNANKQQQSQLLDAINTLRKFNRIDSRSFETYIFSNIEKQRTLQAGFKQRQRPNPFYNKQINSEQEPRLKLLDNRLK